MFQTNFMEKIKTHISCSVNFYENCALRGKVKKHCKARQAIDDNMEQTLFILGT